MMPLVYLRMYLVNAQTWWLRHVHEYFAHEQPTISPVVFVKPRDRVSIESIVRFSQVTGLFPTDRTPVAS